MKGVAGENRPEDGAVDAEDRKREHLVLRVSFLEVIAHALDDRITVVSLVSQAEDRDRAREALMANYGWDKARANAVLQLRLERLTQADRKLVHDELRQLREQLRADQ